MADNRVQCEVVVPQGLRLGVFANAVRIVPDGADFFLDFILYSANEQSSEIVSRVRVNGLFLEDVRDRLDSALLELSPVEGDPN